MGERRISISMHGGVLANSIVYMQACRKAGVPCELHLFMEGKHGMSLANEDWATNNIGESSLYTMMQQWQTMKVLYNQNPEMIPDMLVDAAKAESLPEFAIKWSEFMGEEQKQADVSISQWIPLAWLNKVGIL